MTFGALSVRCAVDGDLLDPDGGDPVSSPLPDGWEISPFAGGAAGRDDTFHLSPLCGEGLCVPDSRSDCPGQGGAGGASPDLGLAGAAGGIAYDPGEFNGNEASCQVRRAACDSETCGLERVCAAAGASEQDEPCVTGSDCAPGLACVGEGVAGTCRPFCCAGTEASCSEGTFCDERQLLDAADIYVPVCLPTNGCSLNEPFPCPEGQTCACEENRACLIVRPDGSTACTVPGPGQTGDSCSGEVTGECAHGFVCSPEKQSCLKLCSTVSDEEDECPDSGTCQNPPGFPRELGICAGLESGIPSSR